MPRRGSAPVVEGSHTISPIDGSSKLRFSSTSVGNTVSTHKDNAVLHPLVRFGLLLVSIMTISASLYTVTEPFMVPQRAAVMNEPELWRSTLLMASRVVPLFVAYELGFDGYKVGALIAYLRQPFWLLLILFYDVPLPTVLIDIGVDLISALGAFSLLGTASKPYPKTIRSKALFYTYTNRIYVSLLTVTVLSVILLLAKSSGYLSSFMVQNFYPVPTVEPLYKLQLPQAFFLLGLSAFIPPFFLASPPRTPHFSFMPASFSLNQIAGRIALLQGLVALEAACHTFAAINGASLQGALGYAAAWAGSTTILGVVMTWISDGAEVTSGDKEYVVEEVEYL